MKLFNKILFGSAIVAVAAGFTSCKEEATLGGADAVYIELGASNPTMLVGDTLRLTAKVTNVSGKEIKTPITWSVDDENIVELVEIHEFTKVKNPNYTKPAPGTDNPDAGSADEGDDNGDNTGDDTNVDNGDNSGEAAAQSRAEEGEETGDNTGDDNTGDNGGVNTTDKWIYQETISYGLVAQPGAQGKSTAVRATLENGMFAMTTVSVGRNSLTNAIEPNEEFVNAYIDAPGTIAWFKVSNIALIDDYDVSFKVNLLECATDFDSPEGSAIPAADRKFQKVYGDTIVVDSLNSLIGCVFTAPRIAGKAEVVITIGNNEASASAKMPVVITPDVSPGLEYVSNGKIVRPNYGPETPSNIKPKFQNVDLDVNSTYLIGVCQGVQGGRAAELYNAACAEDAGYYQWSVEGSAIVVEDIYRDWDYESGFVSYLKVRSGKREGEARVTYTMPGYELISDIRVSDFNVSYPVEDIVVKLNNELVDPAVGFEWPMGKPLTLEVSVEPTASFGFHIPVITSSDPTIVDVQPRGDEDGYTRMFSVNKMGSCVLTMKSLDVTKDYPVTIVDAVNRVAWGADKSDASFPGNEFDVHVNVYMYSNLGLPVTTFKNDLTWTSSDPTVATIEAINGDRTGAHIVCLADGETTITCQYEEGVSTSYVLTVKTPEGVEFTSANVTVGEFNNDEGFGSIYLQYEDGTEYFFDLLDTDVHNPNGSYTGVGTLWIADQTYDGCTYSITFTNNGDGTITVNGYMMMGATKYSIVNVTVQDNS